MPNQLMQLEQDIADIQQQLVALPPGKLIICKNESRTKWYISDGLTKSYLPKSERSLTQALAKKKFLTLKLHDLEHRKKFLQASHKNTMFSNKCNELLINPFYHELLSPFFQCSDISLQEWISQPYQRNEKFPEQLIHKSSSGNYVRSKSEAFIDSLLYQNKIPYRYECVLQLDDITLFPDFTILHPKTRELIYWEHFCMMDSISYSKNAFTKLQFYSSHNIIPSINLITTYETKDYPLCLDTVNKIIEMHFLTD